MTVNELKKKVDQLVKEGCGAFDVFGTICFGDMEPHLYMGITGFEVTNDKTGPEEPAEQCVMISMEDINKL